MNPDLIPSKDAVNLRIPPDPLHEGHGCEPLPERRSTALIQRWRPSEPRTRPHHSCRSFTYQSSWPAFDHPQRERSLHVSDQVSIL
jgi:hypothetical protein